MRPAPPSRQTRDDQPEGGPASLERLRGLVANEQQLRKSIDTEVDQLATAGVSWPVIATVLGVTRRQAARQAHNRRHPAREAAPESAERLVAARLAS